MSDTDDRFDLHRFVAAQVPVYANVVAELEAGRKRSHWMWFVFPQLRGLGSSPTAVYYAIGGIDEATAYLAHPLLGRRLVECTRLVVAIGGRTAHQIFGSPDDLKFHSSLTLFSMVPDHPSVFDEALDTYFAGSRDARTIALLMPKPE